MSGSMPLSLTRNFGMCACVCWSAFLLVLVCVLVPGVSMYPILEPGESAIDLDKLWEQGHDVSINMKLDQQLDHCNEHAGRGFDIHYHGDPVCMYEDSDEGHSPIIGYAADGFAVYGKVCVCIYLCIWLSV